MPERDICVDVYGAEFPRQATRGEVRNIILLKTSTACTCNAYSSVAPTHEPAKELLM